MLQYVIVTRNTVTNVSLMSCRGFQSRVYTFPKLDYCSAQGKVLYRRINYRTLCSLINHQSQSTVSTKFSHVITLFKQRRHSSKFPILYYTTRSIELSSSMALKSFKGRIDHYNGVTVDSNEEPCESEAFNQRLANSLEEWIKDKRRTIWFRVHLSHSDWIPILVKNGFKFHHARENYATLYKWMVTDEEPNIPDYAHTNLGVGGFVYNENTKEVLVIKEKYAYKKPFWKLPGGYVNPGEDLEAAVTREVLEETGIQTNFKCLIGFRHAHNFVFGCSDMYILFYMTPNNLDIKKCNREISECQWMKLTDYIDHPNVHDNNKLVARKMLELLDHKMGLTVKYGSHPTLKKPIAMYTLSKIDEV